MSYIKKMEKANSNRTIQYVISEEGFKYHTRKCVLLKGSRISKNTHSVPEVEALKNRLLKMKILKENDYCYECKKNISTGVLMAYNLHKGFLVQELPEFVVTINGAPDFDKDIKDSFKLEDTVFSADNPYPKAIEKDAFRIWKIKKAEKNAEFFRRVKDNNFTPIEALISDVLVEAGAVNSYRRGISSQNKEENESDIVDENGMRQIEFVSFSDEKISDSVRYKRKPDSEEQALLFEYCDIGYNVVPKGVINKFTKKKYTDKYAKELAIYMIGSIQQAYKKIDKMLAELEKDSKEIINNYDRIHIIVHDPLITEKIYYCTRDKELFIDDNIFHSCPINGRRTVLQSEIRDEEKYFVIKENIFNNDKQIIWMTGEAIVNIFKLL